MEQKFKYEFKMILAPLFIRVAFKMSSHCCLACSQPSKQKRISNEMDDLTRSFVTHFSIFVLSRLKLCRVLTPAAKSGLITKMFPTQFRADTIYIWIVSSQLLFMQRYICFLPGCSGAKIKCNVHVALPKQPINQFKLYQQSRQKVLRAYCPNIYTAFARQNCIVCRVI